MDIGIIGAENSHSVQVSKVLNVQKAIRGVGATHLWGETRALAKKTAEAGQIPNIVKRPEDMLGQIDGVMIDHRDGKHHFAAARPFLKARVPVFVDKPMTASLTQAKRLLELRKECRTPFVTMSVLPLQRVVKTVRRELQTLGRLRALHLYGPGDYKSKYGGIWFYGIHQTSLLTAMLPGLPRSIGMTVNAPDSYAVAGYSDGLTATMHFLVGAPYLFRVSAVGHKGALDIALPHEPDIYMTSTRIFTKMFRTGKEPFTDAEMLAPLAVLDAMDKSLKRKVVVEVPRVD